MIHHQKIKKDRFGVNFASRAAGRWRKECKRAFPSPSVVFRYLADFVNPAEEAKRAMGQTFIPAQSERLQSLRQVNPDLLRFAQRKSPQTEATLEMDASIVETFKQDALFSHKGSPSVQPLSVRWAELDLIAHSEFRDGNVPAACQKELLIYCAEG